MSRLGRLLRSRKAAVGLVVAGVLGSTAAFGFPWSLDMVDAQALKAFRTPMAPLPEGVVSQPNLLTPHGGGQQNFAPNTPEGQALTAPFPPDHVVEGFPHPVTAAELGTRMYDIYCHTCHGDGVVLGPVSDAGFPIVPRLFGDDGRLPGLTDGQIYLTIRNGSLSQFMPPMGHAMTDAEMWSIVHHLRAEQEARGELQQPEDDGGAEGDPDGDEGDAALVDNPAPGGE